jgi:hypothetical protein
MPIARLTFAVACCAGLKDLVRTAGSMPAQANGTAGNAAAHDEYAFPEDGEDEEMQKAYAASMVSPAATAAATTAAAAGTGGPAHAAGAPAGPPKPKGRLKPTAENIMAKVHRDQQRMIARQQAAEGLDVVIPPDSTPPRRGSAEATIAERAAIYMRSRLAAGTNKQAPPAAAVEAAALQPRTQAQPWVSKQMDIRQFTRKVPVQGPSSLQPLPAGMLNHGNTCYVNAILQVSSATDLPTVLTYDPIDEPSRH